MQHNENEDNLVDGNNEISSIALIDTDQLINGSYLRIFIVGATPANLVPLSPTLSA